MSHNERSTLAANPAVANDSRARRLILDPGVKIEQARELVAMARRIAAAGAQALDPSNEAQAIALAMGSAHIENGGVVQTPYSTIFGAPRVVAK